MCIYLHNSPLVPDCLGYVTDEVVTDVSKATLLMKQLERSVGTNSVGLTLQREISSNINGTCSNRTCCSYQVLKKLRKNTAIRKQAFESKPEPIRCCKKQHRVLQRHMRNKERKFKRMNHHKLNQNTSTIEESIESDKPHKEETEVVIKRHSEGELSAMHSSQIYHSSGNDLTNTQLSFSRNEECIMFINIKTSSVIVCDKKLPPENNGNWEHIEIATSETLKEELHSFNHAQQKPLELLKETENLLENLNSETVSSIGHDSCVESINEDIKNNKVVNESLSSNVFEHKLINEIVFKYHNQGTRVETKETFSGVESHQNISNNSQSSIIEVKATNITLSLQECVAHGQDINTPQQTNSVIVEQKSEILKSHSKSGFWRNRVECFHKQREIAVWTARSDSGSNSDRNENKPQENRNTTSSDPVLSQVSNPDIMEISTDDNSNMAVISDNSVANTIDDLAGLLTQGTSELRTDSDLSNSDVLGEATRRFPKSFHIPSFGDALSFESDDSQSNEGYPFLKTSEASKSPAHTATSNESKAQEEFSVETDKADTAGKDNISTLQNVAQEEQNTGFEITDKEPSDRSILASSYLEEKDLSEETVAQNVLRRAKGLRNINQSIGSTLSDKPVTLRSESADDSEDNIKIHDVSTGDEDDDFIGYLQGQGNAKKSNSANVSGSKKDSGEKRSRNSSTADNTINMVESSCALQTSKGVCEMSVDETDSVQILHADINSSNILEVNTSGIDTGIVDKRSKTPVQVGNAVSKKMTVTSTSSSETSEVRNKEKSHVIESRDQSQLSWLERIHSDKTKAGGGPKSISRQSSSKGSFSEFSDGDSSDSESESRLMIDYNDDSDHDSISSDVEDSDCQILEKESNTVTSTSASLQEKTVTSKQNSEDTVHVKGTFMPPMEPTKAIPNAISGNKKKTIKVIKRSLDTTLASNSQGATKEIDGEKVKPAKGIYNIEYNNPEVNVKQTDIVVPSSQSKLIQQKPNENVSRQSDIFNYETDWEPLSGKPVSQPQDIRIPQTSQLTRKATVRAQELKKAVFDTYMTKGINAACDTHNIPIENMRELLKEYFESKLYEIGKPDTKPDGASQISKEETIKSKGAETEQLRSFTHSKVVEHPQMEQAFFENVEKQTSKSVEFQMPKTDTQKVFVEVIRSDPIKQSTSSSNELLDKGVGNSDLKNLTIKDDDFIVNKIGRRLYSFDFKKRVVSLGDKYGDTAVAAQINFDRKVIHKWRVSVTNLESNKSSKQEAAKTQESNVEAKPKSITLDDFKRKVFRYSENLKIKLCHLAKSYGVTNIHRQYGVKKTSLQLWSQRYAGYKLESYELTDKDLLELVEGAELAKAQEEKRLALKRSLLDSESLDLEKTPHTRPDSVQNISKSVMLHPVENICLPKSDSQIDSTKESLKCSEQETSHATNLASEQGLVRKASPMPIQSSTSSSDIASHVATVTATAPMPSAIPVIFEQSSFPNVQTNPSEMIDTVKGLLRKALNKAPTDQQNNVPSAAYIQNGNVVFRYNTPVPSHRPVVTPETVEHQHAANMPHPNSSGQNSQISSLNPALVSVLNSPTKESRTASTSNLVNIDPPRPPAPPRLTRGEVRTVESEVDESDNNPVSQEVVRSASASMIPPPALQLMKRNIIPAPPALHKYGMVRPEARTEPPPGLGDRGLENSEVRTESDCGLTVKETMPITRTTEISNDSQAVLAQTDVTYSQPVLTTAVIHSSYSPSVAVSTKPASFPPMVLRSLSDTAAATDRQEAGHVRQLSDSGVGANFEPTQLEHEEVIESIHSRTNPGAPRVVTIPRNILTAPTSMQGMLIASHMTPQLASHMRSQLKPVPKVAVVPPVSYSSAPNPMTTKSHVVTAVAPHQVTTIHPPVTTTTSSITASGIVATPRIVTVASHGLVTTTAASLCTSKVTSTQGTHSVTVTPPKITSSQGTYTVILRAPEINSSQETHPVTTTSPTVKYVSVPLSAGSGQDRAAVNLAHLHRPVSVAHVLPGKYYSLLSQSEMTPSPATFGRPVSTNRPIMVQHASTAGTHITRTSVPVSMVSMSHSPQIGAPVSHHESVPTVATSVPIATSESIPQIKEEPQNDHEYGQALGYNQSMSSASTVPVLNSQGPAANSSSVMYSLAQNIAASISADSLFTPIVSVASSKHSTVFVFNKEGRITNICEINARQQTSEGGGPTDGSVTFTPVSQDQPISYSQVIHNATAESNITRRATPNILKNSPRKLNTNSLPRKGNANVSPRSTTADYLKEFGKQLGIETIQNADSSQCREKAAAVPNQSQSASASITDQTEQKSEADAAKSKEEFEKIINPSQVSEDLLYHLQLLEQLKKFKTPEKASKLATKLSSNQSRINALIRNVTGRLKPEEIESNYELEDQAESDETKFANAGRTKVQSKAMKSDSKISPRKVTSSDTESASSPEKDDLPAKDRYFIGENFFRFSHNLKMKLGVKANKSKLSIKALAKMYHISEKSISKWSIMFKDVKLNDLSLSKCQHDEIMAHKKWFKERKEKRNLKTDKEKDFQIYIDNPESPNLETERDTAFGSDMRITEKTEQPKSSEENLSIDLTSEKDVENKNLLEKSEETDNQKLKKCLSESDVSQQRQKELERDISACQRGLGKKNTARKSTTQGKLPRMKRTASDFTAPDLMLLADHKSSVKASRERRGSGSYSRSYIEQTRTQETNKSPSPVFDVPLYIEAQDPEITNEERGDIRKSWVSIFKERDKRKGVFAVSNNVSTTKLEEQGKPVSSVMTKMSEDFPDSPDVICLDDVPDKPNNTVILEENTVDRNVRKYTKDTKLYPVVGDDKYSLEFKLKIVKEAQESGCENAAKWYMVDIKDVRDWVNAFDEDKQLQFRLSVVKCARAYGVKHAERLYSVSEQKISDWLNQETSDDSLALNESTGVFEEKTKDREGLQFDRFKNQDVTILRPRFDTQLVSDSDSRASSPYGGDITTNNRTRTRMGGNSVSFSTKQTFSKVQEIRSSSGSSKDLQKEYMADVERDIGAMPMIVKQKSAKTTPKDTADLEISSTWKQVQEYVNEPAKSKEKKYSPEFKARIIRQCLQKGQKSVAQEHKIPYNKISRWRLKAKNEGLNVNQTGTAKKEAGESSLVIKINLKDEPKVTTPVAQSAEPEKSEFSESYKKEVVKYARKHGFIAAAREYKVGNPRILSWIRHYRSYSFDLTESNSANSTPVKNSSPMKEPHKSTPSKVKSPRHSVGFVDTSRSPKVNKGIKKASSYSENIHQDYIISKSSSGKDTSLKITLSPRRKSPAHSKASSDEGSEGSEIDDFEELATWSAEEAAKEDSDVIELSDGEDDDVVEIKEFDKGKETHSKKKESKDVKKVGKKEVSVALISESQIISNKADMKDKEIGTPVQGKRKEIQFIASEPIEIDSQDDDVHVLSSDVDSLFDSGLPESRTSPIKPVSGNLYDLLETDEADAETHRDIEQTAISEKQSNVNELENVQDQKDKTKQQDNDADEKEHEKDTTEKDNSDNTQNGENDENDKQKVEDHGQNAISLDEKLSVQVPDQEECTATNTTTNIDEALCDQNSIHEAEASADLEEIVEEEQEPEIPYEETLMFKVFSSDMDDFFTGSFEVSKPLSEIGNEKEDTAEGEYSDVKEVKKKKRKQTADVEIMLNLDEKYRQYMFGPEILPDEDDFINEGILNETEDEVLSENQDKTSEASKNEAEVPMETTEQNESLSEETSDPEKSLDNASKDGQKGEEISEEKNEMAEEEKKTLSAVQDKVVIAPSKDEDEKPKESSVIQEKDGIREEQENQNIEVNVESIMTNEKQKSDEKEATKSPETSITDLNTAHPAELEKAVENPETNETTDKSSKTSITDVNIAHPAESEINTQQASTGSESRTSEVIKRAPSANLLASIFSNIKLPKEAAEKFMNKDTSKKSESPETEAVVAEKMDDDKGAEKTNVFHTIATGSDVEQPTKQTVTDDIKLTKIKEKEEESSKASEPKIQPRRYGLRSAGREKSAEKTPEPETVKPSEPPKPTEPPKPNPFQLFGNVIKGIKLPPSMTLKGKSKLNDGQSPKSSSREGSEEKDSKTDKVKKEETKDLSSRNWIDFLSPDRDDNEAAGEESGKSLMPNLFDSFKPAVEIKTEPIEAPTDESPLPKSLHTLKSSVTISNQMKEDFGENTQSSPRTAFSFLTVDAAVSKTEDTSNSIMPPKTAFKFLSLPVNFGNIAKLGMAKLKEKSQSKETEKADEKHPDSESEKIEQKEETDQQKDSDGSKSIASDEASTGKETNVSSGDVSVSQEVAEEHSSKADNASDTNIANDDVLKKDGLDDVEKLAEELKGKENGASDTNIVKDIQEESKDDDVEKMFGDKQSGKEGTAADSDIVNSDAVEKNKDMDDANIFHEEHDGKDNSASDSNIVKEDGKEMDKVVEGVVINNSNTCSSEGTRKEAVKIGDNEKAVPEETAADYMTQETVTMDENMEDEDELYNSFAPQKVVLILDISKKHGIEFASTSFGLPPRIIVNWIIEKDRKHRKVATFYTLEEKLNAVKRCKDADPDEVAEELNLSPDTVKIWKDEVAWLLDSPGVLELLNKWSKVEKRDVSLDNDGKFQVENTANEEFVKVNQTNNSEGQDTCELTDEKTSTNKSPGEGIEKLPDILNFAKTTHPKDYSVEQKAIVILLLDRYGVNDVNKKLGISTKTLWGWKNRSVQARLYIQANSGIRTERKASKSTEKIPEKSVTEKVLSSPVKTEPHIQVTEANNELIPPIEHKPLTRLASEKIAAIEKMEREKELEAKRLMAKPTGKSPLKGYRQISPTKIPKMLQDVRKLPTKDFSLEQRVAIVKLVDLYGVRTVHKQFRIPPGSIWNWQHCKSVMELARPGKGIERTKRNLDFDESEISKSKLDTIETVMERVKNILKTLNHLQFNSHQKADAVCLVNYYGIDSVFKSLKIIPRGTLWNWCHNKYVMRIVERKMELLQKADSSKSPVKMEKMSPAQSDSQSAGLSYDLRHSMDKKDLTQKWLTQFHSVPRKRRSSECSSQTDTGPSVEKKNNADAADRDLFDYASFSDNSECSEHSDHHLYEEIDIDLGESFNTTSSSKITRSSSQVNMTPSVVSSVSIHSGDFEDNPTDDDRSKSSRSKTSGTRRKSSNANTRASKKPKIEQLETSVDVGKVEDLQDEIVEVPELEVTDFKTAKNNRMMVSYKVVGTKMVYLLTGLEGNSITSRSSRIENQNMSLLVRKPTI